MEGLLLIVFLLGETVLLMYLTCKSVDLYFFIRDKLNHTVFKKKYIEKLEKETKETIEFNQEKIKLYRGDEQNISRNWEGVWRSYGDGFLEEEKINDTLLTEYNKTLQEVKQAYYTYEEEQRRKNINRRIEFIENELKDIKKFRKL